MKNYILLGSHKQLINYLIMHKIILNEYNIKYSEKIFIDVFDMSGKNEKKLRKQKAKD